MQSQTQVIPFSPTIANKNVAAPLWILANSIKINNRAHFSIQEIMDTLGYSFRTVQRYMSSDLFYHKKEQLALGFTKDTDYVFQLDNNLYHYDEDGTTIYALFPKPFDEVKDILGVTDDNLVEISLEELHRDNVKITNITTAEYILRHQKIEYQNGLKSDKLILDNQVIFSDTDKVDGILNTNRESLVLLDGDVVNTKTNVTQKEIANYLGRSISSVQKHLSKANIDTKLVYATTEELNKKAGKYFKQNPDKNSTFVDGIGFVSVFGGKVFKKISNIYNKTYNFFKEIIENVVEIIQEKFLHFSDVHTDLQLCKVYQQYKAEQIKLGKTKSGVWHQLTIDFLNDSFSNIVIKPDDVIYYEAEKNNPEYGEPGWQRIIKNGAVKKYVATLTDDEYNEYVVGKDDINEAYSDCLLQLEKYHYRDSHPEKAEYFKEQDERAKNQQASLKQRQQEYKQQRQAEADLIAKYEKPAGVSEFIDDAAEAKKLQKELCDAEKYTKKRLCDAEKYANQQYEKMMQECVPGSDDAAMFEFINSFG